jgi:glucose/arabinose dehydrogenase
MPFRRLPFTLALLALFVLAGACGGDDGDADDGPELRYRASTPLHVPLPAGYRTEVLLEGLESPTSLAALPDGRLLIAAVLLAPPRRPVALV